MRGEGGSDEGGCGREVRREGVGRKRQGKVWEGSEEGGRGRSEEGGRGAK